MNRSLIGLSQYQDGLIYYNSDVRGSSTRDPWRPAAIYYNGSVYFTWIAYNGDIYVTKFTPGAPSATTKLIATRAADYNAGGSDIEHGNPTISIDNNGYIYVFYGCHVTQLYYRKSTNPEDISSWSARLAPASAIQATYQQAIVTRDNKMIVFMRHGPSNDDRFSYISTTDGGNTWSAVTDIINPVDLYTPYPIGIALGTETPTQSIHVVTALRNNTGGGIAGFPYLNYMVSYDGMTTWKDISGNTLTVPTTEATVPLITSDSSWTGDIKLNSLNQPYIVFNDTTSGPPYTTKFTKWNGSSWSTTTIASVAGYQYEMIQLDLIDDNTLDAYTINGTTTTQGGNIVRYRSTDAGATWSLAENITTNATATNRYYFPQIVKNHDSKTKLIYMFGAPVAGFSNIGTNFKFFTYPS